MKPIKILILIMFAITIYNVIYNGDMTYKSDGLYFIFCLLCALISIPCTIVLFFEYISKI